MNQQDIEKLLKESEAIVTDSGAYAQFQQNREAIIKEFWPDEGLN